MRLLAAVLLAWAAAPVSAQIPDDDSVGTRSSGLIDLGPVRGLQLGAMMLRAASPVLASSTSPAAAFEERVGISTAAEAAMVEDARRIFVELRFRLAPYDPAPGIDKYRFWKRVGGYGLDDKARDRAQISVAASRAPGSGLVAAPVFDYDLERLEEISAVDAEGREHPAKPLALPRRGNAVWFQADGLKSAPLPPLRGGDAFPEGRMAKLMERDDVYRVDLSAWWAPKKSPTDMEHAFRRGAGPAAEEGTTIQDDIWLVFDSSAAWRGWLASYRSTKPLSPAALRGETLPWEEFRRLRRRAEESAKKGLPIVRLRFRQEAETQRDLFGGDGSDRLKERADVGFPLAPRVVFVPRALTPRLVKRLESVELLLDGKARPARFVGILAKEVAGYLVAPEADLPPLVPGSQPKDGDLALAVEPFAMDSALQAWAYPDRLEGSETGYDGKSRRKPRFLRAAGALVEDLDAKPFGLMVEENRRESVIEKDRWQKPSPLVRLHPIEELARAFARPDEAVDPLVKPRDVLGGKRRPWLGVETQDLNADLAKLLGVSGPTRAGSFGQLVNEVLPRSPAARAGLKAGDVLLRLRESGKRQDALIPAVGRATDISRVFHWTAASWFRRPNTGLDDALSEIAPGTKVGLVFTRDGKERSAELALQESPPDMESAPKLVDEGTGLSVKEITDDARRLLRVEDGFRGLLIYEVDSGSPAQVAGLRPAGFLAEVDGRAVSTLGDLQAILAARRAAGAASVRVRSLFLGKALYADLRVAPDSAAKPKD